MIVECPCKKKRFKIDPTLIPVEGRNLKCGTCDRVWFYKIENENPEPLPLNGNIDRNYVESDEDLNENQNDKIVQEKQSISRNKVKKEDEKNDKNVLLNQKHLSVDNNKKNTNTHFFSYLVVFIISFVALIILLDTLKTPLINIFPGLEIILFNLFETLKDIKLFIIDLY